MPRRNNREEQAAYEPLNLTPPLLQRTRYPTLAEGVRSRPSSPHLSWRERQIKAEELAARQRAARVRQGIDWSVCVVPGCGADLTVFDGTPRIESDQDPTVYLPMCDFHLGVAYRQLSHASLNARRSDALIAAEQAVWERNTRIDSERKERRRASRNGEMYFVRMNDLVKVGWTRELPRRLKEYGAGAELLCHYPATLDEETTLHRQLRPVLAKGREWYHDGDIIQMYVDQALAKYGPPTAKANWTEPKREVIRLHR